MAIINGVFMVIMVIIGLSQMNQNVEPKTFFQKSHYLAEIREMLSIQVKELWIFDTTKTN